MTIQFGVAGDELDRHRCDAWLARDRMPRPMQNWQVKASNANLLNIEKWPSPDSLFADARMPMQPRPKRRTNADHGFSDFP